MKKNQRAILDEIARRVEDTCKSCPKKDSCPQRGQGIEKIVDCSIERYQEVRQRGQA